jgi:hypothetical protein
VEHDQNHQGEAKLFYQYWSLPLPSADQLKEDDDNYRPAITPHLPYGAPIDPQAKRREEEARLAPVPTPPTSRYRMQDGGAIFNIHYQTDTIPMREGIRRFKFNYETPENIKHSNDKDFQRQLYRSVPLDQAGDYQATGHTHQDVTLWPFQDEDGEPELLLPGTKFMVIKKNLLWTHDRDAPFLPPTAQWNPLDGHKINIPTISAMFNNYMYFTRPDINDPTQVRERADRAHLQTLIQHTYYDVTAPFAIEAINGDVYTSGTTALRNMDHGGRITDPDHLDNTIPLANGNSRLRMAYETKAWARNKNYHHQRCTRSPNDHQLNPYNEKEDKSVITRKKDMILNWSALTWLLDLNDPAHPLSQQWDTRSRKMVNVDPVWANFGDKYYCARPDLLDDSQFQREIPVTTDILNNGTKIYDSAFKDNTVLCGLGIRHRKGSYEINGQLHRKEQEEHDLWELRMSLADAIRHNDQKRGIKMSLTSHHQRTTTDKPATPPLVYPAFIKKEQVRAVTSEIERLQRLLNNTSLNPSNLSPIQSVSNTDTSDIADITPNSVEIIGAYNPNQDNTTSSYDKPGPLATSSPKENPTSTTTNLSDTAVTPSPTTPPALPIPFLPFTPTNTSPLRNTRYQDFRPFFPPPPREMETIVNKGLVTAGITRLQSPEQQLATPDRPIKSAKRPNKPPKNRIFPKPERTLSPEGVMCVQVDGTNDSEDSDEPPDLESNQTTPTHPKPTPNFTELVAPTYLYDTYQGHWGSQQPQPPTSQKATQTPPMVNTYTTPPYNQENQPYNLAAIPPINSQGQENSDRQYEPAPPGTESLLLPTLQLEEEQQAAEIVEMHHEELREWTGNNKPSWEEESDDSDSASITDFELPNITITTNELPGGQTIAEFVEIHTSDPELRPWTSTPEALDASQVEEETNRYEKARKAVYDNSWTTPYQEQNANSHDHQDKANTGEYVPLTQPYHQGSATWSSQQPDYNYLTHPMAAVQPYQSYREETTTHPYTNQQADVIEHPIPHKENATTVPIPPPRTSASATTTTTASATTGRNTRNADFGWITTKDDRDQGAIHLTLTAEDLHKIATQIRTRAAQRRPPNDDNTDNPLNPTGHSVWPTTINNENSARVSKQTTSVPARPIWPGIQTQAEHDQERTDIYVTDTDTADLCAGLSTQEVYERRKISGRNTKFRCLFYILATIITAHLPAINTSQIEVVPELPSFLRNNIIFSPVNKVGLNDNFLQLERNISLYPIIETRNILYNTVNELTTGCHLKQQLTSEIKAHHFVKTAYSTTQAHKAREYCGELGMSMPEPRTPDDFNYLFYFMQHHSLNFTFSNVYYNPKGETHYMSDNDAFQPKPNAKLFNFEKDIAYLNAQRYRQVVRQANFSSDTYHWFLYNTGENVQYIIATVKDQTDFKIICQPPSDQNYMQLGEEFLQECNTIAHRLWTRLVILDHQIQSLLPTAIVAKFNWTSIDSNLYLNSTPTDKEQLLKRQLMHIQAEKPRRKRQFFKQIVGVWTAFIGASVKEAMKWTVPLMKEIILNRQQLNYTQLATTDAIRLLASRMVNRQNSDAESKNLLSIELKGQNLVSIIQELLSYLRLTTKQTRTQDAHELLTQSEFDDVRERIYNKTSIELAKHKNDVTIATKRTHKRIFLIYHFPVQRYMGAAELYEVIPFPSITADRVVPKLDGEYFLRIGSTYTIPTSHAIDECLRGHECQISTPIYPKTHPTCISDVFFNITTTTSCEYEYFPSPLPQFHLSSNMMYFSTINKVVLTMKCPHHHKIRVDNSTLLENEVVPLRLPRTVDSQGYNNIVDNIAKMLQTLIVEPLFGGLNGRPTLEDIQDIVAIIKNSKETTRRFENTAEATHALDTPNESVPEPVTSNGNVLRTPWNIFTAKAANTGLPNSLPLITNPLNLSTDLDEQFIEETDQFLDYDNSPSTFSVYGIGKVHIKFGCYIQTDEGAQIMPGSIGKTELYLEPNNNGITNVIYQQTLNNNESMHVTLTAPNQVHLDIPQDNIKTPTQLQNDWILKKEKEEQQSTLSTIFSWLPTFDVNTALAYFAFLCATILGGALMIWCIQIACNRRHREALERHNQIALGRINHDA